MEAGSYFSKSSFGDAELGKNPVWKNMLMFWVGLIKHMGLKPLFLVHGSYLFLHRNKNLF